MPIRGYQSPAPFVLIRGTPPPLPLFRREEDLALEAVADPEPEEVGEGGAGVVDLVGEDVEGEPQRESDRPGGGPEEGGRGPEEKSDLPGVDEEEVAAVLVVVGGPKELADAEPPQSEGVGVLEDMVEVDEDAGEEEGDRPRERAGDQVEAGRAGQRKRGVVVQPDGKPPRGAEAPGRPRLISARHCEDPERKRGGRSNPKSWFLAQILTSPLRSARRRVLDPDLLGDLVKLLAGDVVERLPAPLQVLVELERLLLHQGVSLLRAPVEAEIGALGHADMPVGAVEAEPEKERFDRRFDHVQRITRRTPPVKSGGRRMITTNLQEWARRFKPRIPRISTNY